MSKFNISIYRDEHLEDRSLGELYVTYHSGRFCFTLEDAIRGFGIKINGKTGLPAGKMKGRITWSPRFKRYMILIYNVSEGVLELDNTRFEGARIHGGNRPKHTDGCPLCAYYKGYDKKGNRIIWSTAEKELTEHVKRHVGYDEFDIFIFNTPKN